MKSNVYKFLILGVTLVTAEELSVDTLFSKLKISPTNVKKLGSSNETVATETMAELIKEQLGKKELTLDVSPSELMLSQTLPNACQDITSCGCGAESRNVQAYATIQKTSQLTSSSRLITDSRIFLGNKKIISTNADD